MKRYLRTILATAGTAMASLALLAPVAQATPPAAPYEDFAGCPSPAEDKSVASCVKFVFKGGHLELGKRDVPIANPVVLRGAQKKITGEFLANAEGGIVPARQPVPGGLIGLTGMEWLDELLDQPQLRLFATVELAGQPGNLLAATLGLPVKVHLENPLLGGNCYVGSNASPIQLDLTTGTTAPPPPNQPISGSPTGELEAETERPKVRTARDGAYVDNSYAVPAASGCVLKLGPYQIPVDKAVNRAYGLAAAAGTNEAVLNYDLSLLGPKVAYP